MDPEEKKKAEEQEKQKNAEGSGEETKNSQQGQEDNSKKSDAGGEEDWLKDLPEDRQKYIKALKEEAITNRKDRNTLKEKVATLEAEKKAAEDEKLKKQGEFEKLYNSEKETTENLKKSTIKSEIRAHAVAQGIIDPVAADLIPFSDVKLSDSFEVLGAKEAVEKFKASNPKFFEAKQADGQNQGSGTHSADPNPSKKNGVVDLRKLDPGSKEFREKVAEFNRTGTVS